MTTRRRSLLLLVSLLGVLGLIAGACSSDDDDAAGDDGTTSTTAANNDDNGGETDNGAGGDVVASDLRLGGPPDCPTNPFCIPGLESVYGVDLSANFVSLDGAGPLTVAALRGGEIDVAVLFSTNPVIAEEGWVVLDDTEGLINADNIVPVASNELDDAYGDDLENVVNAVSAKLTTAELTEMNRQFEIELLDAKDVAADWLEAQELLSNDGEAKDGPAIVIGSQDFSESELLSQVYGQALASAGFDVKYQALGGYRDIVFSSFDRGDINFTVEYVASALEFLNQNAGEATGDVDETLELLIPYLEDEGVRAYDAAPAVDSNSFVVTQETADQYGLKSISDLAQ